MAISIFALIGRCLEVSFEVVEAYAEATVDDVLVNPVAFFENRPYLTIIVTNNFYFILNASVNFVFYCAIGGSFRTRFLEMYGSYLPSFGKKESSSVATAKQTNVPSEKN